MLKLLQALYSPDHSDVALICNEEMLEDIELFSVSSQIYHLLSQRQQLNSVPDYFRKRLKERHMRAATQNMLIKHELGNLLTLFETAKIDVIPLKGTHFSEAVFGNFAARATADIDLLIHPNDLVNTIEMLLESGYQIEEDDDATNNHCSLVKNSVGAPFPIVAEIHWNIDKEYYSALRPDPFFEEAIDVQGFCHIKALNMNHLFYMICLHGARHKMDNIKYFIDLLQLLTQHGKYIDMGKCLSIAMKDRTYKRIKMVLEIVYEQFPFLHRQNPLPFNSGHTVWNYNSIKQYYQGKKTLHYYRYKFVFNYCLFDQWKYFLKSRAVSHWLIPPKNHIRYLLGQEKVSSNIALYKAFYKKRWLKQPLHKEV